jgi:hypothetical protein
MKNFIAKKIKHKKGVQHHAQATTLTNKTSPMPIMAPLNKPINFNVLKPNALPNPYQNT